MNQESKVAHYSSKVKANMPTKMKPEFDENGNQTEMSMLYGTIDKAYLTRLLVEHREKMLPYVAKCKEVGKEKAKEIERPEMDRRLARIIQIIIEKTMGAARFSGYTPEWKEEFRAHALLLILQYVHNYDPVKTSTSKSNDPYNYIRKCVKYAFFQKWEYMNKRSETVQFVPLDEGILHSCIAFDQYAGMVKREKQRRHWGASANAGLSTANIDDTIQKVEKLEKEVDDDNVLPDDMETI